MKVNLYSACSPTAKLLGFIKSLLFVSKKHCYTCSASLGDGSVVINLGQHKHISVCKKHLIK